MATDGNAILSRHLGNMLTHSLGAAQDIAIALCLLENLGNSAARGPLIDALHHALIAAEEVRQAWKERG